MRPAERWRPTAAHLRASIGGVLLAVAAVLGRRPDLLVLATPLAGAAAWATALRPARPPMVGQSIGHGVLVEGEATTWHVSVDDPDGRVEDVAVLLPAAAWTEQRPADGQSAVSLRDDGDGPLAIVVRTTRWGRRAVGPALVVASSAWGAFRSVSSPETARSLLALPHPSRFDAPAPAVHRAGLPGVHRSVRESSGAEFASIRPFQPGDRLRRIHWPQSLRTGALHVTSTWADHDRHVVLLLDALDDVGGSEGVDGRASSLDIALRAAGAVAEHYLSTGDRVGLVMLDSRGVRRTPASTGRRHLRRMLEVMAGAEPAVNRLDVGRIPPGLPSGALVVMLSPLVSRSTLQRAASMAGRRMTVVVIDCLPADIVTRLADDPEQALSWRIRLMEREREIRRVNEAGVPVVRWVGPGSLDEVLRRADRRPVRLR